MKIIVEEGDFGLEPGVYEFACERVDIHNDCHPVTGRPGEMRVGYCHRAVSGEILQKVGKKGRAPRVEYDGGKVVLSLEVSDDQGKFFAEVARVSEEWGSFEQDHQLCMIGQELAKRPEARELVERLAAFCSEETWQEQLYRGLRWHCGLSEENTRKCLKFAETMAEKAEAAVDNTFAKPCAHEFPHVQCKTVRQPCEECGGSGEVQLFTSAEPCPRCTT